MKPLVSVVVPVYNGQDYLKKCIESIWNQTYESIEIIVINDGSTDETGTVCDELIDMINNRSVNDSINRNIRVTNTAGQGVSVARNIGIEETKGDYITFVDADDRLIPNMIETLYNNIISSKCDISGCRFFTWSTEEDLDKYVKNDRSNGVDGEYTIYTSEEFKNEILNSNTRCWSKLYKREAIRSKRFDSDFSIGEDMLFLAKLTKGNLTFCETTYRGYGYYQNGSGTMSRKFSASAMDQIYCWEKARDILGASVKLDSNIIVSILLTVGKMAILDDDECKLLTKEIMGIHCLFKKYYTSIIFQALNFGYKIKATTFYMCPILYVKLYNIWKKISSRNDVA